MNFKKLKSKLKKGLKKITILSGIALLGISTLPLGGNTSSNTQAEKVNAFQFWPNDDYATYYLAPVLDPSGHQIKTTIKYDEKSHQGNNNDGYQESKDITIDWGEAKWGDASNHINLGNLKIDGDTITDINKDADAKKDFMNYLKAEFPDGSGSFNNFGGSHNDIQLALSFPTSPKDNSRKPAQTDLDKANAINEGVVADFNQAIAFVYSNRGNSAIPNNDWLKPGDGDSLTNAQMAYLALYTASTPSTFFGTITENKDKNEYTVDTKDSSGGSTTLIYGQSKDYKNDAYSKSGNYITWPIIAEAAVANWAKNDYRYDNMQNITKPDKLTGMLVSAWSGMLSGLATMFGIPSIPDMIFNLGSRSTDSNFFYGIAKTSWFNATGSIMLIFSTIALIVIAFAIAKDLLTYQKQTITLNEKITLWDDIKNLFTVISLLVVYPWIFVILLRLNYALTKIFSDIAGGEAAIGTFLNPLTAQSMGTLAGLVMATVFFILQIYFFYYYTFRAIMIMVLNVTAPIYISALALGDNYQPTFVTWFKELLGNIFVQAFQGIILAIFVRIATMGSSSILESIFMIVALLPLSKWFRESLQIQGGMAGELSSGALAMGGSTLGALSQNYARNNSDHPNNGNNGDKGRDGADGASVAGATNSTAGPTVGKGGKNGAPIFDNANGSTNAPNGKSTFLSRAKSGFSSIAQGISNAKGRTPAGNLKAAGSAAWQGTKTMAPKIGHAAVGVGKGAISRGAGIAAGGAVAAPMVIAGAAIPGRAGTELIQAGNNAFMGTKYKAQGATKNALGSLGASRGANNANVGGHAEAANIQKNKTEAGNIPKVEGMSAEQKGNIADAISGQKDMADLKPEEQGMANMLASGFEVGNPQADKLTYSEGEGDQPATITQTENAEKLMNESGLSSLNDNARMDEKGNIIKSNGIDSDQMVATYDNSKMSKQDATAANDLANAFDKFHKANDNLQQLQREDSHAANLVKRAAVGGTHNMVATHDNAGNLTGFKQQISKQQAGIQSVKYNNETGDLSITRQANKVQSSNAFKDATGVHTSGLGSAGQTSFGAKQSQSSAPAPIQKVENQVKDMGSQYQQMDGNDKLDTVNGMYQEVAQSNVQSTSQDAPSMETSTYDPNAQVDQKEFEHSLEIHDFEDFSADSASRETENNMNNLDNSMENHLN